MNIHKIIVDELRRRGWSAYRLSKETGVAMRTTQHYVAGDHEIRTGQLAKILDALDLRIVRKGGK